MKERVNWQEFAAGHNMKWSKKSCSWDSGAFLGNGNMGAMIYSAEDKTKRNTLRCVMGRTDVEARTPGRPGVYTRVPLGELDLEMKGWIFDGTSMELDLYQAEFKAELVTTVGKVKVRSLVHSLEPVMMVEVQSCEGEKTEAVWKAYPELSPVIKNEDGINYNQYIPHICLEEREYGTVHVQIQRFFEAEEERTEDGCVVAVTKREQGTTARYYLTILKGCGEKQVQEAVETVERNAVEETGSWEERHRQWWRDYYQKSFVSLTDTRLEGFYLIQMYKMASATRAHMPVMDNQGPWMAATPWPRAWFNMNVQTAYSPVYTSNHLDIGESLCSSLDRNMDHLINNVEEEYRKDSAGLGRSAGCNMVSPVEDEVGNLTWLLHNYWRQCRYSMDRERMRESLYPLLKRSVAYYLHKLEQKEDKKLHLPPMISPEYGSFRQMTVEDSTYDLALLRWGCTTLLQICQDQQMEDPDREIWQKTLRELTEYHQDETGLMVGKDVPLAFGHRHFSHLLPIFPLHLIRGDKKEEKELILRCLRHWFCKEGDLRGFTFSGAASIAAAAGLGDEALAYVKSALHLFKPNTMYTEAGPVIESPLGVAESIHDMLLQSWGGIIRVFPAVPGEWEDITIHNLRAEGAFLISAVRREGKTCWIRVESLAGEPCRLAADLGPGVHAVDKGGKEVVLKEEEDGTLELNLKAGEEWFLYKGTKIPDFVIEPVKPQSHMRNFFGEHKPWRLYGIPFSWEG
ncbi:MAG: hypothetical protein HFG70_14090 [Hungatella sp.]|nr:hypothetical protein [Hungatella sp.]